mgnify:CR=1 FL=1
MLRRMVGLIVGIFAGALMVALIEAAGQKIFPPPPGADLKDPAQLRALMSQLPVGALVSVVVAWVLGAVAGGQIAMGIARDPRVSLAVGFFLTVMGAMTMSSFPHPIWMWIAGLLLPVPSAWLGARLSLGAPPAPPASAST